MRALILLFALLLPACATTRQCSIGVALIGPVLVPTVSCDVFFEPPEEEDEEPDA